MVVKSQIKLVKSLQQKKYRNQQGLFVAEGVKVVRELLESHFTPRHIFSTDVSVLEGFLEKKDNEAGLSDNKNGHSNDQKGRLNDKEGHSDGGDSQDKQDEPADIVQQVSETELRKMSGLTTPNTVIGVFEIAAALRPDASDWILALDDVRDPGNLGTIIRLCDWFGIEHLVCSSETVDCYNPKVLQATMGSIARVKVGYTNLEDYLKSTELPVFGAFMDGQSVHSTAMPEKGILVMGNESHGISPEVEKIVSKKISIPHPGTRKTGSELRTAESLNVATATAILLHEIRRV